MAILDEIDSGLDIDALRDVANAVNGIRTENTGVLLVTHYKVRFATKYAVTFALDISTLLPVSSSHHQTFKYTNPGKAQFTYQV